MTIKPSQSQQATRSQSRIRFLILIHFHLYGGFAIMLFVFFFGGHLVISLVKPYQMV